MNRSQDDGLKTGKQVRAYSRPILNPTIERCPVLCKLCTFYFDTKHLEQGLNRGEG